MTLLYCSKNEQTQVVSEVTERGFAYGDGHFTTAKIIQGKVEHLTLHMSRLCKAHELLGLNKHQNLQLDINRLAAHVESVALNYQKAVIKIVVTSGAGGRGYSRLNTSGINVYVMVSQFPEHYEELKNNGIKLGYADFILSTGSVLAGVKHLNRLEQVMIRAELDERDEDDLLVCDAQGHVIEASSANVFWRKGEQWFTPALKTAGVDGVYRQFILLKSNNITTAHFTRRDLLEAEAMFISNSIMGIVPVKQLDDKVLSLSLVRDFEAQLS